MIEMLKEEKAQFTIIGNGSNLLVSDDGIEGVVIALGKQAADITIEGEERTAIKLIIESR